MRNTKAEHGTRAKWNAGCRCKECIAANSAYSYARYWRNKWDDPLASRLIVTGGLTLGSGKLIVPKSILIEALNHHADSLRMTMLELLHLRNGKKGQPHEH